MRFLWLLLSVAASVSVEAPPADAALLVHLGEEEVAVVSVEASGQVEVGEDAGKCRDSKRCKKYTKQFGMCKGKAVRACRKSCGKCSTNDRSVFTVPKSMQHVANHPTTLR
mmetsp:Transcript_881/g.2131  ORF Transcript_881/g.2131 Transcript_881/m.2131 type:complete len:111 (+) Transcript_881:71-403(+)